MNTLYNIFGPNFEAGAGRDVETEYNTVNLIKPLLRHNIKELLSRLVVQVHLNQPFFIHFVDIFKFQNV